MSRQKLLLTTAPAVLSLFIGCGQDSARSEDESGDDFAEPRELKAALEDPIIDCQSFAAECGRDARDDSEARVACGDQLAACLQDAAARARRIAEQVHACREEARACVRDDNDRETCRDGFRACVKDAFEAGAVSDAGMPADAGRAEDDDDDEGTVDTGVDAGRKPHRPKPSFDGGSWLPPGHRGSMPSFPTFPGFGNVDAGAILDNLSGPLKCIVELQTCVIADPSTALQCAETARTCLNLP